MNSICPVLRGRLIVESLRVGADLTVADLRVVRVGRHDVTASTVPASDAAESPEAREARGAVGDQPRVWTFLDFQAPDHRAEELATALAAALETESGWWADFVVGDDHVVIFTDRVFRYRIGDRDAREQAVAWGRSRGTPAHQLDWGE
jgi:hypothetical protein